MDDTERVALKQPYLQFGAEQKRSSQRRIKAAQSQDDCSVLCHAVEAKFF